MPSTNRNNQGSPKLIYRIDSRTPQEIFEQGFTSWGRNYDFFNHILGHSLGSEIDEDLRSGIISASDSPNSALRFFGGMLTSPDEGLEFYLYEIRADENVYSALRTASFYQQRIQTNQVSFEDGDIETMTEAVNSIFDEFAYQREWFNVGNIPRERIRSAWRVDSVSINPLHITHQPDTVYFTPRINDPEIFNPHYIDDQTFANDQPYTQGATIATISQVSIPNELLASDATGGVASSLGFACFFASDNNLNDFNSNNNNNNNEKKQKLVCYYDSKKIDYHLNQKQKEIPFVLSKSFPSLFYVTNKNKKDKFLLSWANNQQNKNYAALENASQPHKNIFYKYSVFQTICWKHKNEDFMFALTPINIGFHDKYDLTYAVATVNNETQKWVYELIETNGKTSYFRIKNVSITDFSLHREIKTNHLYLMHKNDHLEGFEEVYLIVGEGGSDSCIILAQNIDTKLIDLQLAWTYQNISYIPIPEKGNSKAFHLIPNMFFYDLNTYKILYINHSFKIFALYNNRNSSQKWNWIRWRNSDMKKTNDNNFKWYFQNEKWNASKDYNFRNIRSFNNDYLRVVVSGTNWGYFYTTPLSYDINSISLFRIDKTVDI